MSDLMREEFEVAFVAEEVRRCGEGMRSSALYMVEQDTVNVRSAWWAWQASRECLAIELPKPGSDCYWEESVGDEDAYFDCGKYNQDFIENEFLPRLMILQDCLKKGVLPNGICQ